MKHVALALALLQGAGDFEREVSLREAALAGDAQVFRTLATSERWTERARAFDLLARHRSTQGDPLPGAEAFLTGALADPHPNVRARALGALFHDNGRSSSFDPQSLANLVDDPLPLVRRGVARLLGRSSTVRVPGRGPWLVRLARDPDRHVREAARSALFLASSAPGFPVGEAVSLLVELAAAGAEDELLRLLRLLAASPAPEPVLDALEARLRDVESAQGLLAATRLHADLPADPLALVGHWRQTPYGTPRARFFEEAAGHGDETLAEVLLDAIEHACTHPGAFDHVDAWLDASIAILKAPRVRARLAGPQTREVILVRTLEPLAAFDVTWDLERDRAFLGPERNTDLRGAALDAFETAFVSWDDEVAGELVAAALGDAEPALARQAFRALAVAPSLTSYVDRLHTAWLTYPEEERAEILGWFPRGAALAPFRGALLELGSGPSEAGPVPGRRQACELLQGAAGDAEVFAILAGWLFEDLVAWEEDAEFERTVLAEVRALGVHGEAAVRSLVQALETAAGRSTEVAKSAAFQLGKSEAGRRALVPFLDEGIERRVRIECAIAIATGQAGAAQRAAVEWLARDLGGAAWDLAPRMIAALGKAGGMGAEQALLAILDAPRGGEDDDLRLSALRALAGREATSAATKVGAFGRAARRSDTPFEVRVRAVEALGFVEGGAEELLAFYRDLITEDEAADERELLRGVALAVLAEAGALPEELEGHAWRGPDGAAGDDLAGRLRGDELSEIAFRWRPELRLAEALAEDERLVSALGRTRWMSFDGRLLLEVGELAMAAGDLDDAWLVLRAACIALEGEASGARSLPQVKTRARISLFAAAWSSERWGPAERLAAELLFERRVGELSPKAWRAAFGSFQRMGGSDPEARLAAAHYQARARRLAQEGDLPAARAAAGEAARRVGRSWAASGEQARLEAELR